MTKEYIVAISDGEKSEKQIIENIQKIFFIKDKDLIILPFKTDIFTLYKVLNEDNFHTDIIEVLIETDLEIKKNI